MLKEFRISNYRSINKEQIFTMEACSPREVSEYPSHVVHILDQNLLKVSSIYGPNGSGKTNLLNALLSLSCIVMGKYMRNDARGNENYMPCLLCDNANKYTNFIVVFVTDEFEIAYSLVSDLRKIKSIIEPNFRTTSVIDYSIIKEEFEYRQKGSKESITLYQRNNDGVVSSDLLQNIDLIKSKTSLNSNTSFVKYIFETFGNKDVDPKLLPIIKFFREIANIVALKRETITYLFTKEDMAKFKPFLEKTKLLLTGLDISIKDIFFKEVENGVYCLYLTRQTSNGNEFEVQLISESSGTRKLVNIILDVLTTSGNAIFIADDFDSHLHPKLIRAIIELFTSSENLNKQLIFNSHDITNMNNRVFRRDEIWFAQRSNDDYSTTYIPLSNIIDYKGNMVRKDAVYGKQYLEGKYGADPFIKKGLDWDK